MAKGFRKFGDVTLKLDTIIEGKAAKRRAKEYAEDARKRHAHVRVVKRAPGVYAIYTSAWAR